MVKGGLSAFRGKRILLLQGPMGPFFWRLADDLSQAGAQVFKVNLNGGDWFFYRKDAFNFRGRPEDWPSYFENLIEQLHVDMVMLFGDCRIFHRVAHKIAQRHGLAIGVFEEGYVRPHYVTLEEFGVNGNSPLPRSPIYYLNNPPPPIDPPLQLGSTFWHAMRCAMLYYFAAGLLKPFFPDYIHHRLLTWAEARPWLRSFWRKGYYAIRERGMMKLLTESFAGQYFLVPLQVHNDAQISEHSPFDTVADFINKVMVSFANHAHQSKILVIKHHPLDRGYSDYASLIANRIESLGLKGRCLYIHDQHLPTLLDHACGVIVVNSTVGMSAILHGAPVKVCGTALYDMKGLTFQGPLNRFWREARHAKPDMELLKSFHDYLVQHSQLNGSFYKRLKIVGSATGLKWAASHKIGGRIGITLPVESIQSSHHRRTKRAG